jgi:DNA-binding beta-propeller fold protein YncE
MVLLPFQNATSGAPVAGAQVQIAGGDFDSTTSTDSNGVYFMDDVPARTVTISASVTACLSGSRSNVVVRKADTVIADVTLESHADADSIPLPRAGAARMEIAPAGGRAVLLYDGTSTGQSHPSVAAVDLNSGAVTTLEFPDLTEAYDIRFIDDGEFAFNFHDSRGYGLRFVSFPIMASTGDFRYCDTAGGLPGRLTLGPSGEVIFVTHQIFQASAQGVIKAGKVYAVSIPGRRFVDADNDTTDGETAFDTSLALGSLAYPYYIAYDPLRGEILVGNHDGGFLTAIAWSEWGRFVRQSKPATQGVRKIPMNAEQPSFQVWFFGFAGGIGIAGGPQTPPATVRYESGEVSGNLTYSDVSVNMSSDNHFLTVVPSRQSWFTLCQDVTESDIFKRQTAVEERSWNTLHRLYRFESRHFVMPDRGQPRAFAVDAANKKLYVAYRNRPILEVFCLP